MSTRISLVYLQRKDGTRLHIYQECLEDGYVYIETVQRLCSIEEWNTLEKDKKATEV